MALDSLKISSIMGLVFGLISLVVAFVVLADSKVGLTATNISSSNFN
jgi:hypothetical protein